MNDIILSAALKSAKFVARKHPDKPDTILRRVQFQLLCPSFDPAHAEWLGEDAIKLRMQMQSRTLNKFELLITACHFKMAISGMKGNAESEADGIKAVAAVVGKDEDEHEELTLTFEAPIDAKLLTFVGASLSETVECELKAAQLEFGVAHPSESIRDSVRNFAATLPKGTSATFTFEGESTTLEGTGDEESP